MARQEEIAGGIQINFHLVYGSPILARRHKLVCSANSAKSSCFTHVAIRNGFDRVVAGLRIAIGGKTGN